MMRHWNAHLPWWSKIVIKLALSRIPVDYAVWRKIGAFRHGAMDTPEYAFAGFEKHFEMVGGRNGASSFAALELGPGDSLFSALVVNAFGGERCWLVDVGRFARADLSVYDRMVAYIRSRGLPTIDLSDVTSVPEVLDACNATYLTEGLASLRQIPDASVDFIWSRAVLEHIRRHEFGAVMRELRRIVSPLGACSHRVDLRDHLGGGLNNLRFTEAIWESGPVAHSGFYTNRIRFSEMLRYFADAGFVTDVMKVDRWDELPISRNRLARRFRTISDEDLRVLGFDVVLKPH